MTIMEKNCRGLISPHGLDKGFIEGLLKDERNGQKNNDNSKRRKKKGKKIWKNKKL